MNNELMVTGEGGKWGEQAMGVHKPGMKIFFASASRSVWS